MSTQAALQAPAQADQLNARNFKRLAEFIHGYSGIKMPANKRTMLEGRLRHKLGCGSPSWTHFELCVARLAEI